MKLEGIGFKNSETCEGVVFADKNATLDISIIDIKGRYPESGWAVNETVHEMVYVKRGMGNLALKGDHTFLLEEGDAISVAPGKQFAWDGDMTIIMACNPPFNSDQYKWENSNEV